MSALTDAESRALGELEALGEQTWANLLAELIAIPSVTGSDAETDAQQWYANHLRRIGLDVDMWECDLAALRNAPGFPGTEAERTTAWGVVGKSPECPRGPEPGVAGTHRRRATRRPRTVAQSRSVRRSRHQRSDVWARCV